MEFDSPIQGIKALINLTYNISPLYIEIAEILYVKIKNITDTLTKNYKTIKSINSNSKVIQKILVSLENEDTDKYKVECPHFNGHLIYSQNLCIQLGVYIPQR